MIVSPIQLEDRTIDPADIDLPPTQPIDITSLLGRTDNDDT